MIAVLDDDQPGAQAVLGTSSRTEAAQVALCLAQWLTQWLAGCAEDRDGLRADLAARLQAPGGP